MNLDISEILEDWSYEPGKITVRRIRGKDNREKIQLRLDLGLLQMEARGRPDGKKPHGFADLYAYYRDQLDQFKREHGNDKGFELDEKACELLRAESVMYYHRYLAQFVLEDYDRVVEDAMHNLEVMDFCNAYAAEPSDRYMMEQHRPYVLMMYSRAKAQSALSDNRPKAALAIVKHGMEKIEKFYNRFNQEDIGSGATELAVLQALAKEVESRVPVDPLTRLRRELKQAVDQEDYERAAELRDRIRNIQHEREAEEFDDADQSSNR